MPGSGPESLMSQPLRKRHLLNEAGASYMLLSVALDYATRDPVTSRP